MIQKLADALLMVLLSPLLLISQIAPEAVTTRRVQILGWSLISLAIILFVYIIYTRIIHA